MATRRPLLPRRDAASSEAHLRPTLLHQPCRVPARTRTVGTRVAVRTANKDIQCQFYYGSFYSVACQTDAIIPEVEVNLAHTGASCETCCQFFFKKDSADRHWRIQHSTEPPEGAQEPYCCPYCAFSTYSRKYAQDHEGIHVQEAFTLRLPATHGRLQNSSLVVHAVEPSNESLNMCRFCKKYFPTKQHRITHEKRHARRVTYTCDLCPQHFTRKLELDLHRKSHTDQPQYVCQVCHRSFHRKQGLACHTKRQVCKRPVECTICQRRFSCKEDLIAHAEVHKKEKPFECDVCHRRFPQLSHLITHRKTHEQKDVTNLYSCNVCQRSFAEVGHLTTHKRIHGARVVNLLSTSVPPIQVMQRSPSTHKKLFSEPNVQTYSCGTCQESFSCEEVLEEHERNTHGGLSEKPLVCIVCHKTFPHKMGLLSHHCTLITTRMIAASAQNASLDELP